MARAPVRRAQRVAGSPPSRRVPGAQFFKETLSELRKVVWPTREQATRLTVLVVVISVFVGFMLGIVDLGFGRLFRFLV